MRTKRKSTLQSLENATRVLEALRLHPEGLGLTELSRLLGLSKPSTFRILKTLVESQYLTKREATNKYRLGMRLWQLGCAAVDGAFSLREIPRTVLRRLAEKSGETVNLAVYDRGRVIYIDSVDSPQALKVTLRVGEFGPAYCLSPGKALLAYQPPEEIEQVIRGGLKPYTSRTIVSPEKLRRELARVRAQGVAFNFGEYRPGVAGMAVPIEDSQGRPLAALSIAGPLVRFSRPRIRTFERLLREIVSELAPRVTGIAAAGAGRRDRAIAKQ